MPTTTLTAATLVPGEVYRRKDLHEVFGGQRQGGISTPTRAPVVLLFTGEAGKQYGYTDGPRPDGTFWYTGEGQVGDMKMAGGNRAIQRHLDDGKDLLLFEYVSKGQVRFVGHATYAGHHAEVAPDRNSNPRQAIVFELALDTNSVGTAPALAEPVLRTPSKLRGRSLAELRELALAGAPANATPQQRKANAYTRSSAVREYVLKRAGGICEGCLQPAPFQRPDGQPYLEPHHIRRRADGGPDHPGWVVAVCPNCHRRVHSGKDGKDFNNLLAERVGAVESR